MTGRTSARAVTETAADSRDDESARAAPARSSPWGRASERVVTAVAFLAYLAFSLFVTWPWATDPGGILYGVIGGDLTASVASYQQLADESQPPFLPGTVMQINAPEGVPTDWAVQLAGLGSSLTLWLLSLAFGAIAAHGLMAVFGFTLSAFAMFLLTRWITGHAGVAFTIGLAFGFWPYMYATGWTWPHYIHLWVLVLLVWRMLVVAESPTPRNGLLAGGAAAFAMTWIQYNLLIAGVAFATLAVVAVARSAALRQLRPQLIAQALAASIVLLVAVGVLMAGRLSGYGGVPARTQADAVANSARPAMYVVPGPRHPLLGDKTAPWLYRRFSPTLPEPTHTAIYAEIYLGIPLLILALVGAVWTVASVWRRRWPAVVRPGAEAAGVTALVLGVVALAFSAPPKVSVFGVLIPMPYTLVQHATTVFRVAHRFAVLVMLAACILAALGLVALVRRRPVVLQAAVLGAVAVVLAVDLRAQPSPSTTKVEYPSIYALLKRQPPGIVAEYPLNTAPVVGGVESFYQEAHGHRLFAGAPTGAESESRKLELQFLLAKGTVPDLAAYGVDYVLVHHPDPTKPPLPGQAIRGLRRIGGAEEATLYRVVARPSRFTSYGVRGFHLTEAPAPGFRWMAENGAELALIGRCRPCVGTVTFPAAAFAVDRMLTIHDERGHTVFSGRITNGDLVRFPVTFSGRTVLRLSTDPPPTQINSFIPGPDSRPVSISLHQPIRFIPSLRKGHRWIP